jgi:hypothetical protein
MDSAKPTVKLKIKVRDLEQWSDSTKGQSLNSEGINLVPNDQVSIDVV